MRLIGFKYLRKKRILTLALILTMASILFSTTAFSLLGFYKGFNAYLGEEEDIVAIYNRASRTPFTGIVPMYLTEPISIINGVSASSPEVIVPCTMKNESTFLRGIIPEEFSKLNHLSILEGDMLELSDINSMVVGRPLAEKLDLKLGEKVLVLGVLADRYMELQVKGIYDSQSAMDDEGLIPLYVGQWLRGISYEYVTLIRVKIDHSEVSQSMLMDEIAKEASQPSPSDEGKDEKQWIMPTIRASFSIEEIGVEEPQRFMKRYMDRYGVTREALLILSLMVFSFASASVITASKTLLYQHKGEIEVLRSVGASNRTIKTDLLAKVLPWSLAFSMAGTGIGILALMAIERSGRLQVLSHGISFQFDPLILALQLIFSSSIVALSLLRSFRSKI